MNRDDSPQYVLPVVLHLEKDSTLTHETVLQHMGSAMAAFLSDPRVVDGEWSEQVAAWTDGRIRKVVRRARGAKWVNVLPYAHLYSVDGVEIAILPPVPLGEEIREVKQLQVSGLDLERSPFSVQAIQPGTLLVGVSEQIFPLMSTGKAMAQVGHAVHIASLDGKQPVDSRTQVMLVVAPESELLTWDNTVRDAGFTEIPPNSVTTAYKWVR